MKNRTMRTMNHEMVVVYMRIFYRILVSCALALVVGINCGGVALATDANQKIAIGVLDFQSHNQNKSYGKMVTDFIVADLSHIKSCVAVERNELEKVFSEQQLSEQGIVEKINSGKYQGKGINYVLTGSISTTMTQTYDEESKTYDYRNAAIITAKLIDLNERKGQIVWTGQRSVEHYNQNLNGTIEEAAYDVMRQLYELIPVKGYVIKKNEDQYYIDLGSRSGIIIKDILKVEGSSDSMVHPVTGKVIAVKSIVGKLKVTEVYEDFCVARPEGKKAMNIYSGDQVIRELRDKPSLFLGIGWTGKHTF